MKRCGNGSKKVKKDHGKADKSNLSKKVHSLQTKIVTHGQDMKNFVSFTFFISFSAGRNHSLKIINIC